MKRLLAVGQVSRCPPEPCCWCHSDPSSLSSTLWTMVESWFLEAGLEVLCRYKGHLHQACTWCYAGRGLDLLMWRWSCQASMSSMLLRSKRCIHISDGAGRCFLLLCLRATLRCLLRQSKWGLDESKQLSRFNNAGAES